MTQPWNVAVVTPASREPRRCGITHERFEQLLIETFEESSDCILPCGFGCAVCRQSIVAGDRLLGLYAVLLKDTSNQGSRTPTTSFALLPPRGRRNLYNHTRTARSMRVCRS
jgi:hypothetical protein